jgi:hypothetical protein
VCQPVYMWLPRNRGPSVVIEGSSVACGAREIACAWAGIAWTTLLLIMKLRACLGLSGSFCNTLYASCASS